MLSQPSCPVCQQQYRYGRVGCGDNPAAQRLHVQYARCRPVGQQPVAVCGEDLTPATAASVCSTRGADHLARGQWPCVARI